ncbi:glycosyltransferase family 2 protein [Limosilactobacillus mucosae]
MKDGPLVSVIIPVYNNERTLKKCITSIVDQTYQNVEIILVDDGSHDNSRKICNSFKDERISVIHNSNHGVAYSRNCGIENSRGDYITFCDADDYYDDTHIEELMATVKKYNADITVCGYYTEDKNGNKKSLQGLSGYKSKEDIIRGLTISNIYGGFCWNKLFKKNVIGDDRFPDDLSLLEDTYFFLKVLQKAKLTYYLSNPSYHYCYNKNSITRTSPRELIRGDRSLYLLSYNKIMNNIDFSDSDICLIKAAKFEIALGEGRALLNSNYKSKKTYKNLSNEISKNKQSFFKCADISTNRKIKRFIQLLIYSIRTI